MRRYFIISWPQAVGLLFIAGTIIFRPVLRPIRSANERWTVASRGPETLTDLSGSPDCPLQATDLDRHRALFRALVASLLNAEPLHQAFRVIAGMPRFPGARRSIPVPLRTSATPLKVLMSCPACSAACRNVSGACRGEEFVLHSSLPRPHGPAGSGVENPSPGLRRSSRRDPGCTGSRVPVAGALPDGERTQKDRHTWCS